MAMARMLRFETASAAPSGSVIWGLIAASFVLEIVVFAVCVAIVRKRRK